MQELTPQLLHDQGKMPVLFVGHGSPMNAIEENEFSLTWREIGEKLPTPDHYLPMLYALALRQKGEPLAYFNDKPLAGSLTMTSFLIG